MRLAPLILAALPLWGCRQAGNKRAREQLKTLEDILRSGNDNDPRLDTDFKSLSVEAKSLLREKYAGTPPERRNDRGTIVFLLGKNLETPEDWAFLRAVVGEPACLSLADCSKTDPGAPGLGDEVTLAYPALVALRQAADKLPAPEAAAVVAAAKSSKVPAVARMAARIQP